MRHRVEGNKIGMLPSHRRSVLATLTNALILNAKVDTTFPRAKAGQQFAERVITLARRGDLHARRIVFSRLRDKEAVDKLFSEIGPAFKDKDGGYTRVVKLGPRKGDGAEAARLMLVQ